ncbi:hypothetical protein CY35_07G036400 [Sphagnum magellanicum]|uniref:Uncharacterized protein n=1 Tax=Sphagnum magellanicum TaxID=128215 RepID=A0ACB8HK28_9BRYO|nr:hypothetical protein CY35_07G036400 [Sphagnum magellanicum]
MTTDARTSSASASASAVATLPLKSLNHISRNCKDLEASIEFYQHLLGFVPVKRPGSLNFAGAWLFNYGIGIHLLQAEEETCNEVVVDASAAAAAHSALDQLIPKPGADINPRDNHISFQCDDILLVEQKLQENGVKYVRSVVVEDDIEVDQLFFHDPDGHMIEVCNCENLPVEPIIIPTPHLIKTATMKKQRVVVAPSLSSLISTDLHFSQKLDNYKSTFAHWWVSLKYLWI